MVKSRLKKIKEANEVLNYNNPAWKEEIEWLIEQTEKYIKIENSWLDNQENGTILFLRTCKEVIEDFEIPKRKRMT